MIRNFTRSVFFLLAFFLLGSSSLFAQSYDFAASSGTFTPLTGATPITSINADEAISSFLPIGFSFSFFGSSYTQFKVSSNGYITFDPDAFNENFNDISNSVFVTKMIAPLWDDHSGAGGTASYKLEGSGTNHILTVEWLNWKWKYSSTNPTISFQVKLYEADGKIELVYRQESQALTDASASIGIVGNNADAFYSLDNTSASPTLSLTGNNILDLKPATGQIYSFIPGATITVPVTQASSVLIPSPTASSMNISWTNGSGSFRSVFVKQTASISETVPALNNNYYPASTTFGNFSSYVGNDWYCVYSGTGTSVSVAGLQAGLTYRVHVAEYNGLGGNQKYNVTSSTNNPFNATTILIPPTAPISVLVPLRVSSNGSTIKLQSGNGTKRVIFMKAATTGTAPVVDNTTYTANTTFGSGGQIGVTGWYCVYNGTGVGQPSITVSGLSGATTYQIHAIDYNGTAGAEKYFISSATGNPIQMTTFVSAPDRDYTFTASVDAFTPITGGTDLNSIEGDDLLSSNVPIGFTFYLSGSPFTQLKASSNGFLTFNPYTAWISSNDMQLNNLASSQIRPVIAPLWDDLDGTTGGQVKYTTTGVTPNRIFTIEYLNFEWHYFSTAPTISFQVRLYETTNKIEYVYRPESGSLSGSEGASIGFSLPNVSNGTGTPEFYSLNNFGASPAMSGTAETLSINTKPVSGQIYSFTPQKLSQTITGFTALSAKTFGDAAFILPSATATSALAVSFSSSNTAVATVSGSTVTIIAAGTTTITAIQNGNNNYAAAPEVPQTLTVNKKAQTITFSALPAKSGGDPTFNLTATSTSSLPVTYTSSNTAVATINGTAVTITGAGTTTITANQVGNANYLAATGVPQDLTVSKSNQTITFNPIPEQKFRVSALALILNSSGGLPIVYTSSNTAVVTVSGNKLNFVGLGTTTITASQPGTAAFNAAASIDQTFTVVKGDQTIDFPSLPIISIKAGTYTMKATASSNLPITYVSSKPDVISISGDVATILKAGSSSVITVSQAGNEFFNAAQSLSRTFYVKTPRVLYFPAIPEKSLGDPDFYLPSQNTYTSSNTAVATITGNLVKIVGKGTTNITGSSTYTDIFDEPAEDVTQTLVVKSAQTVTFGALEDKTAVDQPFVLTATSSTGLPITFTSSDLNVATVNGSTVTIVGIGTTTITAVQAGDTEFALAQAVQDLKITKAKPVIIFEPVSSKTYGDASVMLSATSTSPSPITFASSSAVAFLRGNEAVLSRPGLASVRAYQESNSTYEYGSVDLTFCVNPPKPTIRVDNFNGAIVLSSDNGWGGNQWLKDGVEISDATTTSLTVTEVGAYTTYSKIDGCEGAKSDPKNIVVTALEDVSSLITVSPNPTQREIRIDLTSLGKEVIANITINDLAGRTVHSSKGTGVVIIDIASYEKGNYIIGIKSGNRVVTKQLAKN